MSDLCGPLASFSIQRYQWLITESCAIGFANKIPESLSFENTFKSVTSREIVMKHGVTWGKHLYLSEIDGPSF